MSDEVERLFDVLRGSRFRDQSFDPRKGPLEGFIGGDRIEAAGYIAEGAVDADSFDTTAPAAPTGLAIDSDLASVAGGQVVRLKVSLTQPADTDLFASYVEVTADNDLDPETPQPDWTRPDLIIIGVDKTEGAIEGVRGVTTYWARAYAVDVLGNRSSYTSVVSTTTVADAEAPGQPQNFSVTAGFAGFAASWSGTSSPDLMFNELRYAVDDGTGTGPDTGAWVYVRARTNVVWVGSLTFDQLYWVQVRSVDYSGNTVTSSADDTPVNYLQNPDAGFTTATSVTPSQVGSNDIAAESITSAMIAAAGLSADVIKSGYLKINTSDAAMADGLEVWNNGIRIGKWDETGLYVYKESDPTDYVLVYDAGITVYLDGVAQTAITPDGINASALTFGALPGGHNLVQNSSMELAAFGDAPSQKDWDLTADFTGTDLSSTNATNSDNVVMTAASY